MLRILTHQEPVHPGAMLAEEFLAPMQISAAVSPRRPSFPSSGLMNWSIKNVA